MKYIASIALFLISPFVYSQDNGSYIGGEILGLVAVHAVEDVVTSREASPVWAAKQDQMQAPISEGTVKPPASVQIIKAVRRDMPMFSGKRQEQAEAISQKPVDFRLMLPKTR